MGMHLGHHQGLRVGVLALALCGAGACGDDSPAPGSGSGGSAGGGGAGAATATGGSGGTGASTGAAGGGGQGGSSGHGHVTSGLVAAWGFDESSGSSVADSTGNGHDGTVNGSFAWEGGKLHHIVDAGAFGWTTLPRQQLLDGDFTVDVWLEAQGAGDLGAGRVLSAATDLGGVGPEWFFRSGLTIAMRINNQGATWDEPLVGTRSSPAPPDHYALPTTPIQSDTLTHYLVTHDSAVTRVRTYQAPASAADLELVLDATYSGTYQVTVADLRLSHSHRDAEPRYFDGKYYQLLIYDRALSASEVEQNHDAGADSL